MDPAAAKQQIAERVKQANKFLVTVNANPTVDQLAACIGLTLLLNKMGKHAIAVFSGRVPSTIEFLQPEKTLQANPDSLRDFIISLDKNKADKLRYKVEDDVVRIFITPYRTTLTEKDFVFSEGDYNVEVVMALGVAQRSSLDAAITAHGRILHDATVVSINTGAAKSPGLGQINWQDSQASSLSEMLVSISEAFGPGLIDSQIATAFLTGIVAETERFSNKKTSPKVMTMSAQLMAAGANQQLIVSKLEPPPPPPPKLPPPPAAPPKPREPQKPKPELPKPQPEGIINVPKDDGSSKTDIDLGTTEIHIDEQGNLRTAEEERLAESAQAPPAMPAEPLLPVPEPEPEIIKPPDRLPEVREPAPPASPESAAVPASPHAFMGGAGQPEWAAPYDLVPMDPFSQGDGINEDLPSGRAAPPPAQQVDHEVDEIGQPGTIPRVEVPSTPAVHDARSAVNSAIAAAPYDPAFGTPVQSLNAQPISETLHSEPIALTPAPSAPSNTPSLVLPPDGAGPVGSTPPLPELPEVSSAAPPPMPPPLMAGPGAVVPPPPQNR